MTFNGAALRNYDDPYAATFPDFGYKVDFPGGPGLWLTQADCVHYGAQISDLVIRIVDEYEAASIAAAMGDAEGAEIGGEEHEVEAIVGAKFAGGELYLGVLWHNAAHATWEKAINCAEADVKFNEFVDLLCGAQ